MGAYDVLIVVLDVVIGSVVLREVARKVAWVLARDVVITACKVVVLIMILVEGRVIDERLREFVVGYFLNGCGKIRYPQWCIG